MWWPIALKRAPGARKQRLPTVTKAAALATSPTAAVSSSYSQLANLRCGRPSLHNKRPKRCTTPSRAAFEDAAACKQCCADGGGGETPLSRPAARVPGANRPAAASVPRGAACLRDERWRRLELHRRPRARAFTPRSRPSSLMRHRAREPRRREDGGCDHHNGFGFAGHQPGGGGFFGAASSLRRATPRLRARLDHVARRTANGRSACSVWSSNQRTRRFRDFFGDGAAASCWP